MRINNLGNVGIGTTLPESLLHIYNPVAGGAWNTNNGIKLTNSGQGYSVNSNNNFVVGTDGAVSMGGSVFENNALLTMMRSNNNDFIFFRNTDTANGSTLNIRFAATDSGYGTKGIALISVVKNSNAPADTEGYMAFSTMDANTLSEQLRIAADGNVGIGSVAPQAKLDVEGSVYVGNGNIGIGTAAPAAALDMASGGIRLGSVTRTTWPTGSGTGFGIDAGTFAYYTGGNVGLGTAVPGALLHVGNAGNAADASEWWYDERGIWFSKNYTWAAGKDYDVIGQAIDMRVTPPEDDPGDLFVGLNIRLEMQPGNSYDFGGLEGARVFASHLNGGDVGEMSGGFFQSLVDGGGTVATATGVWASVYAGSSHSGTITNAYALQTELVAEAGTITNAYGVYIQDVQGTNQWGLYQVGATDKNYFAGNVGIGSSVPSQKVDVIGTVKATAFIGDGSGLTGLPSGGGWTRTGTKVFVTTTSDYVGIGTSNPYYKLDVQIPDNDTGGIELRDGNNDIASLVDVGGPSDIGQLNLYQNGTSVVQVTGVYGSPNYFNAGNKVGIGTSEPAGMLDLVGGGTTSATASLVIRDFTKAAKVTVLDDGNVGIGVTAPLSALVVPGSVVIGGNLATYANLEVGNATGSVYPSQAAPQIAIDSWRFTGTYWSQIGFNTNDTSAAIVTGARIGAQHMVHTPGAVSSDLAFWTTNSGTEDERMRIQANGNVGIGSSAPASKLDLAGSFAFYRAGKSASASSAGETIIGVTDTSAARTITMSTSDMKPGRILIVKDESGAAGTNNITVDTQGAETVDGQDSVTITADYGVVRVYSNGSNWFTF
jgi:hypothetical protein